MMIRLIKVIKKYKIHFIEQLNSYNIIINEIGNWNGEMDDNTNIKTIKKNTINKSLKELAEKMKLKLMMDRKVVKKYWYKESALD